MVNKLRCLATNEPTCYQRVVGRAAMVVLLCLASAEPLPAQAPGRHYLHHGTMPPGAIGSLQLQRGGPLPGFFQPVQIKAPSGVLISLAEDGQFGQPKRTPLKVGMLIGRVYRIRVINIPLNPGMEVFPTIEVIDRLYAPRGQERRFPIVIELTQEDLLLALDGKFVTRVIYLEDPQMALPVRPEADSQVWFEAASGRDPLAVADELGRPVAILRMGARLPDHVQGPDMNFLFGCPPLMKYPLDVKVLPRPPKNKPASAAPTSAAAMKKTKRLQP